MTAAAPRPDRPIPDTDSESWWAAIQNRTLLVNSCRSCHRPSLYVRPFCPHCWGEDVEQTPASGLGRLYTWSEVHQNAAPFTDQTPYVAAMVDLAEGPRVMTVIEGCEATELEADMELEVSFRVADDGFQIPIFRPRSR